MRGTVADAVRDSGAAHDGLRDIDVAHHSRASPGPHGGGPAGEIRAGRGHTAGVGNVVLWCIAGDPLLNLD
eukprot:1186793-Prorocentrum_minimum.AAC.6